MVSEYQQYPKWKRNTLGFRFGKPLRLLKGAGSEGIKRLFGFGFE
jgi:hypothetical protein